MKYILTAILACVLATMGVAYGQTVTSDIGSNAVWNWDTSNVYQIHQVHVGDRIYVTNTDSKIHSIRGSDAAGEIFQSSAMYPGQQFEMTFLFPGNFTFYDEYNGHNFGVIEIYNPADGFPPVSNYTTGRDSYSGDTAYSSLADNSTLSSGGDSPTPPTLSFSGTSNATYTLGFGESNATESVISPPVYSSQNNTVAYWQQQSQMWENKYNNLYDSIRNLLGI